MITLILSFMLLSDVGQLLYDDSTYTSGHIYVYIDTMGNIKGAGFSGSSTNADSLNHHHGNYFKVDSHRFYPHTSNDTFYIYTGHGIFKWKVTYIDTSGYALLCAYADSAGYAPFDTTKDWLMTGHWSWKSVTNGITYGKPILSIIDTNNFPQCTTMVWIENKAFNDSSSCALVVKGAGYSEGHRAWGTGVAHIISTGDAIPLEVYSSSANPYAIRVGSSAHLYDPTNDWNSSIGLTMGCLGKGTVSVDNSRGTGLRFGWDNSGCFGAGIAVDATIRAGKYNVTSNSQDTGLVINAKLGGWASSYMRPYANITTGLIKFQNRSLYPESTFGIWMYSDSLWKDWWAMKIDDGKCKFAGKNYFGIIAGDSQIFNGKAYGRITNADSADYAPPESLIIKYSTSNITEGKHPLTDTFKIDTSSGGGSGLDSAGVASANFAGLWQIRDSSLITAQKVLNDSMSAITGRWKINIGDTAIILRGNMDTKDNAVKLIIRDTINIVKAPTCVLSDTAIKVRGDSVGKSGLASNSTLFGGFGTGKFLDTLNAQRKYGNLTFYGTSNGNPYTMSFYRCYAGAYGSNLEFFKSKGSYASQTPVANGDQSMFIGGYSMDSSGTYSENAGIYINADSIPTNGKSAGRIDFYTINAAGAEVKALSLDRNQNATFTRTVTATTFSGAGTGLTGTGASFTAGNVTNPIPMSNDVDVREEFIGGSPTSGQIGENGWTLANNGTNSGITYGGSGGVGIPAVLYCNTGTTTTGYCTIYMGNTLTEITLTGGIIFEWKGYIRYGNTGADTSTIKIGFGDVSTGADFVDGAYFMYIKGSANWYTCTANGSSRTQTASATAVPINTWMKLKIRVSTSVDTIEYYQDGISIGKVTTNIPTGNTTGIVLGITKTTGTTGNYIANDYMQLRGTISR